MLSPVVPGRKLCGSSFGAYHKSFSFYTRINNLPDELRTEIFHQYLHIEDEQPTYKPKITAFTGSDSSPILLTHVCSEWRQFVKSTPSLWSSITLYDAPFRHVPLVQYWLKCAGNQPLSITIELLGRRNEAILKIMDILITRSHRWKSIDFYLNRILTSLTNIPLGSLKSLVHARVHVHTYSGLVPEEYLDKLWNVIHSSPNLTGVCNVNPLTSFPSHTPWGQLKAIEYCIRLPIKDLLHSLQFCHNLEDLEISVEYNMQRSVIEPVELPRLKRLDIFDFTSNTAFFLVDALITPQLTTLNLTCDDGVTRSEYIPVLKNFAERSGFKLSSFGIINHSLKVVELLEWLMAPSLSTVTEILDIEVQSRSRIMDIIGPPFTDTQSTYMETVISCILFLPQCQSLYT